MNVYVLYDIVSMFLNDVVCDRDIVSLGNEIPMLKLIKMCIVVEECILTLLVDWNHIDENYYVVRVEGGSYDYVMV